MMQALDTSVVLRLLTGQPAVQAQAAQQAMQRTLAPLALSDLVLAESYFALRHHYLVPHGDVVRALRTFVGMAPVRASDHAMRVLGEAERASGPGLVDRLIHAECVAAGGTLLTFDRALAKLSDVQLLR